MFIKFRYNDWEIPQLIHLITIALELCPRVDELRDLPGLNKFSKVLFSIKM
jgi:hypothetical protein